MKGVKKVLIASGVRYDLAIESPEDLRELASHHTGGYLKIAPEAIGEGPFVEDDEPGVGAYYRFKELFDKYSKEAGKEQYLISYFIAAHPGTRDQDMLELALWVKNNGFAPIRFRHSFPHNRNRHRHVSFGQESAEAHHARERRGGDSQGDQGAPRLVCCGITIPTVLREALKRMGRADLIGNGKHHLIPAYQPVGSGTRMGSATLRPTLPFRTQHTELPKSGRGQRTSRSRPFSNYRLLASLRCD